MIELLVTIGALAGAGAGVRGLRLVVRGVRHADEECSSLDVIRGIRGIAVAVGTGALAAGVLLGQRWLLAFGLVFLLEELYETGVVSLVLRAGRPHQAVLTSEAETLPVTARSRRDRVVGCVLLCSDACMRAARGARPRF